MICIYHSRDLDGWMSAAIVRLKYPDVELLGWSYGDPVPDWENVVDGHKVVMCDISFPVDVMEHYLKYNDLVWIDHHISAILAWQSIEMFDIDNKLPKLKGLRDAKFAACELTWEYYFPEEPMPEIVRLLGRYDCFGHKGTDEEQKVLEFQYGARSFISNPNEAYRELVDNIHCDHTDLHIWSTGRGIYKYLCTEATQIYKKKFEITLDGCRFACVNQERFNPINFGIDYHKDGYDGFACFWYENEQFIYSLYNDNGEVDCSVICKKRGGGGYKGAAGFRSKIIII
jgi:hypothetical protein